MTSNIINSILSCFGGRGQGKTNSPRAAGLSGTTEMDTSPPWARGTSWHGGCDWGSEGYLPLLSFQATLFARLPFCSQAANCKNCVKITFIT